MNKLDLKQVNNLTTGKSLAIEIPSSTQELRAFIVLGAYVHTTQNGSVMVSKVLNDKEKENMLFWMRKYEIKKEYIENEWDVSDNVLINSVHIKGIKDIAELENELLKYLDDLAGLDVSWKCDNPV